MITEDYVSFETAILLKEKEFNVPCLNYYDSTKTIRTSYDYAGVEGVWANFNEINDIMCSAPTLQRAMKWLREVQHCVICITPLTFYCGEIVSKWGYCIWADDNTEVDEESSPRLESYEEACEAAIKYCLENLI